MTWHIGTANQEKKNPNKNYSKDSEEPLSDPQMKSLKIAKSLGPYPPHLPTSNGPVPATASYRCSNGCIPCRLAPRKNTDQKQNSTPTKSVPRHCERNTRSSGGAKQTTRRAARKAGDPGRNGGEGNTPGLKRRMREEQWRTPSHHSPEGSLGARRWRRRHGARERPGLLPRRDRDSAA
jgi:hypothetical protein